MWRSIGIDQDVVEVEVAVDGKEPRLRQQGRGRVTRRPPQQVRQAGQSPAVDLDRLPAEEIGQAGGRAQPRGGQRQTLALVALGQPVANAGRAHPVDLPKEHVERRPKPLGSAPAVHAAGEDGLGHRFAVERFHQQRRGPSPAAAAQLQ